MFSVKPEAKYNHAHCKDALSLVQIWAGSGPSRHAATRGRPACTLGPVFSPDSLSLLASTPPPAHSSRTFSRDCTGKADVRHVRVSQLPSRVSGRPARQTQGQSSPFPTPPTVRSTGTVACHWSWPPRPRLIRSSPGPAPTLPGPVTCLSGGLGSGLSLAGPAPASNDARPAGHGPSRLGHPESRPGCCGLGSLALVTSW